jgi:hypothetical protein
MVAHVLHTIHGPAHGQHHQHLAMHTTRHADAPCTWQTQAMRAASPCWLRLSETPHAHNNSCCSMHNTTLSGISTAYTTAAALCHNHSTATALPAASHGCSCSAHGCSCSAHAAMQITALVHNNQSPLILSGTATPMHLTASEEGGACSQTMSYITTRKASSQPSKQASKHTQASQRSTPVVHNMRDDKHWTNSHNGISLYNTSLL